MLSGSPSTVSGKDPSNFQRSVLVHRRNTSGPRPACSWHLSFGTVTTVWSAGSRWRPCRSLECSPYLQRSKCWRRYVARFLSSTVIHVEPQLVRENATVLTGEQTEAFETICAAYGAMCASQSNVAIRVRGEAGTGKSRVLNEICWMTTLPEASDHRHHMFTANNVLLVTLTGVLSAVYRRCWIAADNIEVDTFDGAFDSLKKCVDTAYQLRQFVWIVDE